MQLRGEDAPAGIVHDLTFPDVLSSCRKSSDQHSILEHATSRWQWPWRQWQLISRPNRLTIHSRQVRLATFYSSRESSYRIPPFRSIRFQLLLSCSFWNPLHSHMANTITTSRWLYLEFGGIGATWTTRRCYWEGGGLLLCDGL